MADTLGSPTPTTATSSDNSAPVVETNAAPATKAPDANEAFARKERQIRRMQQELQMQRQQLDAKQKSYETDYVPKSRLKEDFWSVAQEAGLDYDQLTEQVLAQPNDPATKAIMAKMKAMEDKLAQADRTAAEKQAEQYQAAIKQIGNEVKLLVDGDAEFETIKTLELYEDVVARIESDFKETGIVRNTREVALEVENELIEDAIRFASLPKVQSRLKPAVAEPTLELKQAAQTYKRPSNTVTITNRMQQDRPKQQDSASERRARAIAAFQGIKE